MEPELSGSRNWAGSSPSLMAAEGRFSSDEYKCGADRMVIIELEAAEALAGMAHSGTRQSEDACPLGGESGRKAVSWRVKYESSASVSVSMSSDPPEDRAVLSQHQRERICKMARLADSTEENGLKSNPQCNVNHTLSGGSKSRLNLTEAEKEARRLRRILANRESARQTIRRRQALYEDLTRKAGDLSWENENLKKELDMAMKEYDTLKNTNECLKAQMEKTAKAETMETEESLKSTHVELCASPSMRSPCLTCSKPSFLPFVWPLITQPSNPGQLQCRLLNETAIPSDICMLPPGKSDLLQGQENPVINGPNIPYYVVPCSWFFPLHNNGNSLFFQPFDQGTSLESQGDGNPPLETTGEGKNDQPSLIIKVKTEASSSKEAATVNKLHEIPSTSGGDVQHKGPDPNGMVLMPAPLICNKPAATFEAGNGYQSNFSHNAKPTAVGQCVNVVPDKNLGPTNLPNKRVSDSVAAAVARKRRKELKKLKNLNFRQLHMHC